ncbi:nitrous oxide reductase accessory protein NosL [Methylococcus sp. Mc7]|uniref:nitrous oxide reductase accessory protein NosL n=1 Tax=Methylococcus sp. Mc7 TaxID=2860258 RepID=UPI001C5295A1|nr:nitrous oxide reductase accessory protein NosL [Methylococcus sp. Mc7]QXP84383.1 nitrous oxide reductase accessory protein NosL [Methylococcus sp. Mc7]
MIKKPSVSKLIFVVSLHLVFLPDLALAEVDRHGVDLKKQTCRVCGMNIEEYKRTAGRLVYKDGSYEYTCGVACTFRIIDEEGGIGAFQSVTVHDWNTGKEIDATQATYVVGSEVIPDMIPNYIAFETREAAEKFAAERGGDIMDFNLVFEDSSPRGNTVPFRVRTAVTPGRNAFSAGVTYGYTQKDQVKMHESGVDPSSFIARNPSQPRTPNELQIQTQALVFNWSPTDRMALFMNLPWSERQVTGYQRQVIRNPKTGMPMKDPVTGITKTKIMDTTSNANGIGDIALEMRYNLWRSSHFDKWFTTLVGTTLPTGNFNDLRKRDLVTGNQIVAQAPGMQLGKGTATFYGGLIYSQRWEDFWFHGNLFYQANPENNDHYSYGDVSTAAIGLHYTPSYDLVLGVEMDAIYTDKNQDGRVRIGNTGGTEANVAAVFDYRMFNAGGGFFSIRGAAGLPFYQDLNYQDIRSPLGGPARQVQLGEGFFANIAITWQTRFAPEDQVHY